MQTRPYGAFLVYVRPVGGGSMMKNRNGISRRDRLKDAFLNNLCLILPAYIKSGGGQLRVSNLAGCGRGWVVSSIAGRRFWARLADS